MRTHGIARCGYIAYTVYVLQVLYEARHEDPSSSPLRNTVLNLQQLFFSLQGGDAVDISTEALTRSFGWETADAFVQHDVSELKMLLLEAIKVRVVDRS